MNTKKKIMIIIPMLLLVIGLGAFTMLPANSLTMDVNPSIEIETNRLDRVISIKPLNLDAEQLLQDFSPKNKKIEEVVNDLVDLMILSGHIKGGDDNVVMITIKDDSVDSELLRKVNAAIKSFLENKQIEATILNQSIAKNQQGRSIDSDKKVVIGSLDAATRTKSYISKDEAKGIALDLVNGEIIKFKLDDLNDDDTPEYEIVIIKDGVKYEIEIDAFSGKVKEFEKDDDNHKNYVKDTKNERIANKDLNSKRGIISQDKAKSIALGKVNGKIVKFKLDDDDDDDIEYEIEIIKDGIKYEIEIDAYTGVITEFERDDDNHVKKAQVNRGKISADKARQIALNLVNGTIIEFEEDDDEYEIEIVKDGVKYEIEIDAYTGQVLEFEED